MSRYFAYISTILKYFSDNLIINAIEWLQLDHTHQEVGNSWFGLANICSAIRPPEDYLGIYHIVISSICSAFRSVTANF
jgi:hypothetical protein